MDVAGIAFDLVIDAQRYAVQSRLLGRFNVDNLLAVAGALYALDESPAEIANILSQLQPIHGRMNRPVSYTHLDVYKRQHVLGFTNVDDNGQEGLELAFNDWLRGSSGGKKVIIDRRGRIVESVDLVKQSQPGKDLTLSIDRRIQFLAFRELRNALITNNASSGSAVVLDVATGEVLAMVNLPTFNPNAASLGKPDAPVSYTHLDVYKRQVLRWASEGKPGFMWFFVVQ